MIFFSRLSLERALTHYVAHYHEERNHQGMQNRLLKCADGPINPGRRVERRQRLGRLLNLYYWEAASRRNFQTLRLRKWRNGCQHAAALQPFSRVSIASICAYRQLQQVNSYRLYAK
jgi:hypothetical protein